MDEVTISIHSLQRDGHGDDERMQLVTKGTYEECDDLRILRYDETELTGMEGTRTTIELRPDAVALIRTGTVLMRQEFRPGRTDGMTYRTSYGDLRLQMHTYEINDQLRDGNGTLRLRYDVSVTGMDTRYHELTIHLRKDTH